jgi:hypothetical protein
MKSFLLGDFRPKNVRLVVDFHRCSHFFDNMLVLTAASVERNDRICSRRASGKLPMLFSPESVSFSAFNFFLLVLRVKDLAFIV